MYDDISFSYELKEGCKMGIQENGEKLPAYVRFIVEKGRSKYTKEEYDKTNELLRIRVAEMNDEDESMVVCITEKEFNKHEKAQSKHSLFW